MSNEGQGARGKGRVASRGGWITLSWVSGWGLLLALLLVCPLYAVGEIDTVVRGNQLYEQGDFQAAAQLYEQLVTQGVADSVLYYNLGNAYYKQGEVGRAILNYERASRLAPRDADVRANLALARSQVADNYEAGSASPLGGWLTVVTGWLTRDELALGGVGVWLCWTLLWLLSRHLAFGPLYRVTQYALGVGALLVLTAGLTLGALLYRDSNQPPAIVLSREVKVGSGPGAQYTTEFTLHAGAQVTVLETRGDWVRLALPGEQLQGWAPAEAVARIE